MGKEEMPINSQWQRSLEIKVPLVKSESQVVILVQVLSGQLHMSLML